MHYVGERSRTTGKYSLSSPLMDGRISNEMIRCYLHVNVCGEYVLPGRS